VVGIIEEDIIIGIEVEDIMVIEDIIEEVIIVKHGVI
jgi:hypothetical protein